MSHPAHPAPSASETTRKLLATLWVKNLPVLRERLDQLEEAAKAAAAGRLKAQERREAASTAHKLAGSLGMFGRPKGTELARLLEERFEAKGPLEISELAASVGALRSELGE